MAVHDGYMKNTSSIGIFKHEIPPIDGSMEAVLGPGDMLVMPRGWWHAMRGEGDGPVCSVSIWY
jgi:lysine-specific demethylase 8